MYFVNNHVVSGNIILFIIVLVCLILIYYEVATAYIDFKTNFLGKITFIDMSIFRYQ